MAINFPNNPSIGDEYENPFDGRTTYWNGEAWNPAIAPQYYVSYSLSSSYAEVAAYAATQSYAAASGSIDLIGYASRNTSLSIPNNTYVNLSSLNGVVINNSGGAFNNGTGVFTVSQAGLYRIAGGICYLSHTQTPGNTYLVSVAKGSTIVATSGKTSYTSRTFKQNVGPVEYVTYASPGDTFKIQAYQSSSSTLSLSTLPGDNWIEIEKL